MNAIKSRRQRLMGTCMAFRRNWIREAVIMDI